MKLTKTNLLLKTSAVALIACSMASANAFAQINDEIIVTARKSESSLQDTPLAITALGNAEIEDAAFENIIEVSKAAPGLFIESINGTNARVDTSPRFRGITFDSSSPLQRTASIFIDGTLVTGEVNALTNQEIERIEIIKGPQSALFGRNTFSGAINYVTKAPSNEFGGEISLLAATRNEFRGSASIEGPILGDTLTGRLTGSYDFDGGHYSNIAEPSQDMGEETTWAVSAVTEFKPNDNFRMRLRGSYARDRDGPAAIALTAGFAQHNFGGFPLPGGGTTETAFRGTIVTPGPDDIGTSATPAEYDRAVAATGGNATFLGFTFDDLDQGGLIRDTFRVSLDTTYDFGNDLQFNLLGSYSDDEFFVFTDFDATPTYGFNTSGGRAVEDFSVEARLSGSFGDRLDWSVGGNYLDIDIMGTGGFFDGLLGFWFPGVFADPSSTGAKTYGVFGTLDYEISEVITLILEGRYQSDEISDASLPGVSPGTFEKFLPRVLLQFEPSDATTFYANYSVGNLPGGFNPEVGELDAVQLAELAVENPGVTTTFKEEKLENFELGWKQSLLDGQAAFNLAAFYMKRSDQIFSGFQLVTDTNPAPGSTNPFRTVAFTDNGATTDIKGIELDGTWNMSDHMTLQGSVAWIDAKIDSFPEGTNAGDFTAVFGPEANVQGQQAPRFPPWSGSLSGTYERPIEGSLFGSSDASWYTRGDVFYTGEFFDENTNLAENPSAVDVNLRTGIRRDNIRFEVFVTNLFEEDAPTGANNIADTSAAVRFGSGFFDFSQESVHAVLRDKRQFGARVDVTF